MRVAAATDWLLPHNADRAGRHPFTTLHGSVTEGEHVRADAPYVGSEETAMQSLVLADERMARPMGRLAASIRQRWRTSSVAVPPFRPSSCSLIARFDARRWTSCRSPCTRTPAGNAVGAAVESDALFS